ncbi:MAG: molecular chaperone DnaJ [Candidatus Aenigmarchaeota archaeon]|nr:molecular chaperone DnaJ [Candidatus Aenigmarchaeota archaeon]
MAKDYYKILGVEKNASQDEIKSAYKKLAKKYHPDVSKESNAAEKFKEINEAAGVLGNSENRQKYDQFGSAEGADFSGFDYRDFAGDFGDIFDQFFGGFGFGDGGRKRKTRGRDLATEIGITLKEAATGTSRKIPVDKLSQCHECKGTGAASGGTETCTKCGGQGTVRQARRTAFGVFATTTTCGACNGTGETISNPCKKCSGQGRIEQEKNIEIKIPAGIENGMRLRISGEGEAGTRGAGAGDLYVTVYVEEDERFKRDGQDLYTDTQISFALACLGGNAEIPTLEGTETLRIPAGTQGGTVFRIKEKGLPNVHGNSTGNLYVKVQIAVPKKLTKKQTEILKEFEGQTPDKKGWFF